MSLRLHKKVLTMDWGLKKSLQNLIIDVEAIYPKINIWWTLPLSMFLKEILVKFVQSIIYSIHRENSAADPGSDSLDPDPTLQINWIQIRPFRTIGSRSDPAEQLDKDPALQNNWIRPFRIIGSRSDPSDQLDPAHQHNDWILIRPFRTIGSWSDPSE